MPYGWMEMSKSSQMQHSAQVFILTGMYMLKHGDRALQHA
jgi:hypothetical protein